MRKGRRVRGAMAGLMALVATAGCGDDPTTPTLLALRISPSVDSVTLGATTRLSVVIVASDSAAAAAVVVTWESLDPTVVTISEDGLARGVGAGTGLVTAASEGLSDTAEIVVEVPVGGPEGLAVTSLRLGNGPWDVTQSSQGLVYVTRPGTDSVARLDLATDAIVGSFQVGNRPDEIWFNTLGTRAFVANLNDQTVGVIATDTDTETATFALPGEPLRLRLGLGDAKLYVTLTDGTVAVLDATSGDVDGSIPVAGLPNGLALNSDGSRLYVSSTAGTVTEVNTATDVVTRSFTVGGVLQDLAVAPGDGTLYVANESGSVEFWNLASGNRRLAIPLAGAFGLALTPDGSQLWVTQPSEGTVTVIDCADGTVLRTILTFGTPRHIAITQDATAALVANEQDVVQIIR